MSGERCAGPVMDAAPSDARKAIGSASSFGAAGRPSGIPPSDFMMTCTASSQTMPASSTMRCERPSAIGLEMQPGDTRATLSLSKRPPWRYSCCR